MNTLFRWFLMRALLDERVRAEVAQIVRETQPVPKAHRPIAGKAPGAIS